MRTINITIENDDWGDAPFCYEVNDILKKLAEDRDGLKAYDVFTTEKGTKVTFVHSSL